MQEKDVEFGGRKVATSAKDAAHPSPVSRDNYNPRPVGALHILDFIARVGKFVKEFHSLLNWRENIDNIHSTQGASVILSLRALAVQRDDPAGRHIEVESLEMIDIPQEGFALPNPFAKVGNYCPPLTGSVAPVFTKDAGFAFVRFDVIFHIAIS